MRTHVSASLTPRLTLIAALLLVPGLVSGQQVFKAEEVTADSFTRALLGEAGAGDAGEDLGPGIRTRTLGARPSRAASVSVMITFHTNSATLTPKARAALDEIGKALSRGQVADLTFVLEGHADPRGSAEKNLRLSQSRAESVVAYLVQRHGISPERLQAVGKGDTQPLKPHNPAAPENRRVTFVPGNR